MKKKLFGQNISTDCSYCENAVIENEMAYCKKGKRIQQGKCRAFRYDPLMRVPKTATQRKKYTSEDFRL